MQPFELLKSICNYQIYSVTLYQYYTINTKHSCLFYTNPFFVFVLLLQFFFACKKYIDALPKAVLFLAHVEFKEMGEHETKGEFYEKRITTKKFKEGRTVKTCHIYGFDDFRIHHTKFGFG